MAACYFACCLLMTSVDISFTQHHTTSWIKAVFWCQSVYMWGSMKFCRLKKVFIYFDIMGTSSLYNHLQWVVSWLLCTSHLTGACLFQLVTQNKPYLIEWLHLSWVTLQNEPCLIGEDINWYMKIHLMQFLIWANISILDVVAFYRAPNLLLVRDLLRKLILSLQQLI
jgi:hypothetical protein